MIFISFILIFSNCHKKDDFPILKGDVYVAGITHSIDFPVSDSAYERSLKGGLLSEDNPFLEKDQG